MTARSLAVVGLGGMGAGIARRLMAAGFTLTVHNRTRDKAAPLVADGARLADSAQDAVAGVDAVVLSMSDEAAVEQVLLGEMLPALAAETVVVDTSTTSPDFSRSISARLGAAGIRRVEACVVGNPRMAEAGQLRVFTGGDAGDVAAVSDVLEAIGGLEVRHLGAAGTASVMKLAFNMLLGAQTAGLAEAVAYAVAAGIDRDDLLAAVAPSGFSSPVLAFRAEFMRKRTYEPPAFRASLMAKDLELAVADAASHGVVLPVVESAARRFGAVVSAGQGDLDAAVIVEAAGR